MKPNYTWDFDLPLNHEKFSCTLLIPVDLTLFLDMKLLSFDSYNHFIHYLLKTHHDKIFNNQFLNKKRVTNRYQSGGLSLKKVHFRSDDELWTKLKFISYNSGFSICYIVTFLLSLDYYRCLNRQKELNISSEAFSVGTIPEDTYLFSNQSIKLSKPTQSKFKIYLKTG